MTSRTESMLRFHPTVTFFYFALFGLMISVGCGRPNYDAASSMKSDAMEANLEGRLGTDKGMPMRIGSESKKSIQEMEVDRKIIYTADLGFVVEDFDPVEKAIRDLTQKHGGFVADSNLNTRNKRRRSGTWTLRIPVTNFDAFLSESAGIGYATSRNQNAQDVTEEYVDIEARIANKKKLEARILKLLERPDDKIQHVIDVERELARVREEIERMEGRMRYLKDRIALTTVTISVTEEKEYTPPEAPSFQNRIKKAWSGSLENTQDGIENTIVFLVGNLLPILFWLTVLPIAFLIARRWFRSKFGSQTETSAE